MSLIGSDKSKVRTCTGRTVCGDEDAPEARFIGPNARLDSCQRILVDEERRLDRAVMSPEPHGVPGGVIGATMVRKVDHRDFHQWPRRRPQNPPPANNSSTTTIIRINSISPCAKVFNGAFRLPFPTDLQAPPTCILGCEQFAQASKRTAGVPRSFQRVSALPSLM
jgi:hypothetical protein